MGKRGNNAMSAKSVNKKSKTDAALVSIIDTINDAEELPPRCRSMLVDMLPFSLSLPVEERRELQHTVVNMIEETMHAKRLSLDSQVNAETEQFDKLKASEDELVKTTKDRELALLAQKDVVESLKRCLTDATSVATASSDSLDGKRAAHKATNETITIAKEEKAALESAFSTHFQARLEEGPNFQGLEPFLARLELDASLLTALPTTCAKSKEQRGNFDEVVLEELEKAFSKKILTVAASIDTDIPTLATQEDAVQAAEKQHEEQKGKQQAAASDLEVALKEQGSCEEAFDAAKLAVDNFQPQLETLAKQLESAKSALSAYEAGALSTFTAYKSKTTAVLEESAEVRAQLDAAPPKTTVVPEESAERAQLEAAPLGA